MAFVAFGPNGLCGVWDNSSQDLITSRLEGHTHISLRLGFMSRSANFQRFCKSIETARLLYVPLEQKTPDRAL